MRSFILLAAFVSFIQTSFVPSAFASDQSKILRAMQSVVMVRGYNASGGLAYGSGVMVGDNKVMSNCHVSVSYTHLTLPTTPYV